MHVFFFRCLYSATSTQNIFLPLYEQFYIGDLDSVLPKKNTGDLFLFVRTR